MISIISDVLLSSFSMTPRGTCKNKNKKKRVCLWNRNAPVASKSKIGYFKYKGHGQNHKIIDLGVI